MHGILSKRSIQALGAFRLSWIQRVLLFPRMFTHAHAALVYHYLPALSPSVVLLNLPRAHGLPDHFQALVRLQQSFPLMFMHH
jgi:hypothetical protein